MKLLFFLGLTIVSAITLAIEFSPYELYQQYAMRNYYTLPFDSARNPASSAKPTSSYKLYEQSQVTKDYAPSYIYKDSSGHDNKDPYDVYQMYMKKE